MNSPFSLQLLILAALYEHVSSKYTTANIGELYKEISESLYNSWKENSEKYKNTCAIKLSWALNKAGFKLPEGMGGWISNDGNRYYTALESLMPALSTVFGNPRIIDSKNHGLYGFFRTQVAYFGIAISEAKDQRSFDAYGHGTLVVGGTAGKGFTYKSLDNTHYVGSNNMLNVKLWRLFSW